MARENRAFGRRYQCSAIVASVAMSVPVFLWPIVMSSFILTIDARAVNISNTWMLPEEGFPVFYRHFRDRVSWYEADAVCQFHHANLVTADTTSQYDAIRAYLKELDVTNNVWIGLSKTSDKSKFTWSNYQTLTGGGHWQDTIPVGGSPLCVVMDPSADFLWRPMPCGGPEVATFICELPIPDWATGPKGCLVSEVPSLTILYIPEQSAVELTSDCGLDGTKRIACKGNADRENILKELTCTVSQEDDDPPLTTQSDPNQDDLRTTKSWIWTSNTIDVDYSPTRHRRETLNPISTKTTSATEALGKTSNMAPDTTTAEGLTGTEGTTDEETSINQSHLFSIIENGTMFDFIELSERGNDTNDTQPTSTTEIIDIIAPAPPKKVPKEQKHQKKNLQLEKPKTTDITKEIPMLPVIRDKSLILNRTYRKEVPPMVNLTLILTAEVDGAPEKNPEPPTNTTLDYLESQNNSLTAEPEKIPNRQRHLTRPQRKPFYPYFFSRVLG